MSTPCIMLVKSTNYLSDMHAHEALDMTLRVFRLKAKDIAEASGISEDALSRYRHGRKDLYGKNLVAVIVALPEDARKFFFDCLEKDRIPEPVVLQSISLQSIS